MNEYSFLVLSRPATSAAKAPKKIEDKREAILQAALELFAEQGFYGTAVPEIADRAKVAAGTIYRYFENKEALVNALFVRYKTQLGATLMSDFPFIESPRAQLHHFFVRAMDFARKEPLAFKFLEAHHHGPYLDDKSREVEEQVLQPARQFFAHTERMKVTRAAPAEALAAIIWGSIVCVVRASWEGRLELTDKLATSVEDAIWDAIRRHD